MAKPKSKASKKLASRDLKKYMDDPELPFEERVARLVRYQAALYVLTGSRLEDLSLDTELRMTAVRRCGRSGMLTVTAASPPGRDGTAGMRPPDAYRLDSMNKDAAPPGNAPVQAFTVSLCASL